MVAGAACVEMWVSRISSSGAQPAERDYSTRKSASIQILLFWSTHCLDWINKDEAFRGLPSGTAVGCIQISRWRDGNVSGASMKTTTSNSNRSNSSSRIPPLQPLGWRSGIEMKGREQKGERLKWALVIVRWLQRSSICSGTRKKSHLHQCHLCVLALGIDGGSPDAIPRRLAWLAAVTNF